MTVLCTSASHPVFPWLERWRAAQAGRHDVSLVTGKAGLQGGDALFLVSCDEIIEAEVRKKYRKAFVIHASDLPEGRGWSPHVWQILEGRRQLVVSLIEAVDTVDSGPLWAQRKLELAGHELFDEINARLFAIELELMDFAAEQLDSFVPREQETSQDTGRSATYYRRRTPEDSRLDPAKSIAEQFDLLRVCDPQRYPAFFDLHGQRYEIVIRKKLRRGPG